MQYDKPVAVINKYLAGNVYDFADIAKVTSYAIGIIGVGFAVWAVLYAKSRTRQGPGGSSYFGSGYSKKWKR